MIISSGWRSLTFTRKVFGGSACSAKVSINSNPDSKSETSWLLTIVRGLSINGCRVEINFSALSRSVPTTVICLMAKSGVKKAAINKLITTIGATTNRTLPQIVKGPRVLPLFRRGAFLRSCLISSRLGFCNYFSSASSKLGTMRFMSPQPMVIMKSPGLANAAAAAGTSSQFGT